jgi:hypothetical protein
MNLNVEIPDDLAGRPNAVGGDLSRRALEAFGLEDHDVWINFSIEDPHRDVATIQRLGL